MKRLSVCVICILGLCGCGILRRTSYVAVEPHDENYEVAMDSDTVVVSSYLSMKNAILNFVEDGVKEGVIRAESYRGDLAEDLDQAVREVAQLSPLGAFAVDRMTYDYSKIVSYYEIHINTVYSRSAEEIGSIEYVADLEAIRGKLRTAMKDYAPSLILRVGDYTPFDLEDEVAQIFREHPEFAFEQPRTDMELYPESGTQRILEIRFAYRYSTEQLLEYQAQLSKKLEHLELIYGSANNEMTNAKRFYSRLGRDTMLAPEEEPVTPLTDSPYGLLLENCATSYGFAQTYLLLLRSSGIECELVSGTKDGASRSWCLVKLEGEYYYVDPAMAAGAEYTDYFLMGNAELEANGYSAWNLSELPAVELPEHLRPPV